MPATTVCLRPRLVRALAFAAAALALVFASPGRASDYELYRVTLLPPVIQAFETEDAGGDEIIATYSLERIRDEQVIGVSLERAGVYDEMCVRGSCRFRNLVDAGSPGLPEALRGRRVTLDIRRGDQVRVSVSLLDVDDDAEERRIFDDIRQAAGYVSQAAGFVFPAATPALGLINTGARIVGLLWEIGDLLDEDDDLGVGSYVRDFPTSLSGPVGNLNFIRAGEWNYQVRTELRVSPEFQVLAGDFTGDGKTDIAQLSHAGIFVATAGRRGSAFGIGQWARWPNGFTWTHESKFGVGDVNLDRKADIVIFRTSQSGGQGLGVWVARSRGNGFDVLEYARQYPFYMNPHTHVAVGRVNNDHYTDVIMVENGPGNTENVWVGVAVGPGVFQIRQAGAVPIDRHTQLLTGNFDGSRVNPLTDIVVFGNGQPGQVRVGINNIGRERFSFSTWDRWWMDADTNVLAYDFDGDGKTDILQAQNAIADARPAVEAASSAADAARVIAMASPPGHPAGRHANVSAAMAASARVSLATNWNTAFQAAWQAVVFARKAADAINARGSAVNAIQAAAARIAVAAVPQLHAPVYLGYSRGSPGSTQGSFNTAQVSRWPRWSEGGRVHPGTTPFDRIVAGSFRTGGQGDLVRFEPGSPGDVRVTPFPAFLAGLTSAPWEAGQTWAQWWSRPDVPVLTGDFDGDGRTDIAKCEPNEFDGRPGSAGKIWIGYSTGGSFDTRLVGTWQMR